MRGLRPAAAILGTAALFLWMANRDRVSHGPLFGILIAGIAIWGWTSSIVPRDDRTAKPPEGSRTLGGLLIFVVALYGPSMAHGLWDPWETHYAEVAREILARNDWISLWWAQDKWFWSKPVLLFWMEALSMGALGVDFMPDANPQFIEWAVRLPHLLILLVTFGVMYATVRRVFGERAAVLSALVTATTPQIFLISHQAITDVPLVAFVTCAVCMLILAVGEDPEREAEPFRVGPFTVSLQSAVVALLIAIVLPQALYLLSRNVALDLSADRILALPQDAFLYGSAGNDNVPGNAMHSIQRPFVRNLGGQPAVQGTMWLAALAVALMLLRNERRVQRLQMMLFYIFCGLAFLAKGLPGVALPGVVALLFLVATRRWHLLLEGRFAVGAGVAVVSLVSLPWYVAMYVRHGPSFTNRLLVHDHIDRLASGVHGDTGTIQYFVEQIGYALFPWIGLVPLALLAWREGTRDGRVGVDRDRSSHRSDALLLLGLWFLASFTLFSAMVTKFHHYILPAIVPISLAVGIALSRVWGRASLTAALWTVAAALFWIIGLGGLTGNLLGHVPVDAAVDSWVIKNGFSRPGVAATLIGGLLCLGLASRSLRRRGELAVPPLFAGGAFAVGACVLAFVARDVIWVTSARPQGYERLVHLFVYNYRRVWPEHIDYRPALFGFGLCAAIFVAAATFARFRGFAVRGVAAVALLFTIWSLNVYLPSLAPHWGQKELIARYYERRQDPSEPLVAWQMNWKGENFYTGNRVNVFADLDNKKINSWLRENKGKTAFFIFEHSRMTAFKRLMGVREFDPISTERDNNKFVLVYAKL